MFIERPPLLYRLHIPGAIWRFGGADAIDEHGRGIVYLTFDDGPIPEATPFVLDTLDAHGVKATFFVVGDNVRKHPHIFDMIRRRGHSVGNHTMHHLQSVKNKDATYAHDVALAHELLDTRLFRPPHGLLLPRHRRELLRRGYRIVMHDLVTRDYSNRITANDVLANVKRYARPGSVIVFHDSLRSIDKLREALPAAIEWLKNRGYVFRTIPMP